MSDLQVTCVTTEFPLHEGITHLGGPQPYGNGMAAPWKATREEIIKYIDDHGNYFPKGPDWTIDSLKSVGPDDRSPWESRFLSVSPELIQDLATRLMALDGVLIAKALAGLPRDWPISDDELTEMVFFLERRRAGIVQRMPNLASSPSTQGITV